MSVDRCRINDIIYLATLDANNKSRKNNSVNICSGNLLCILSFLLLFIVKFISSVTIPEFKAKMRKP